MLSRAVLNSLYFSEVEITAKATVTGFIIAFLMKHDCFNWTKRFTRLFRNTHCGQLEMDR